MSKLAFKFMRDFEGSFGYPPGENVLLEASPERGAEAVQALSSIGAPRDLLDFYARVEEVSMPDVGNGLFVHSAQAVVGGAVNGGQPTEVVGAVDDTIVVFGSDGGGGLFALSRGGDKVYHLSGGSLVGSIYEANDAGGRVVANEFWGFLKYLYRELSEATP